MQPARMLQKEGDDRRKGDGMGAAVDKPGRKRMLLWILLMILVGLLIVLIRYPSMITTSIAIRSPLRPLVKYTWKVGKDQEKDVRGSMTFHDRCTVTVSGHGPMGSLSAGEMGRAWKSFSTYSSGYYIQPERVEILEGVTSISPSAFAGYSALEEVYLAGSLASIGDYAFYRCANLHEIHYDGDKESWEKIQLGDEWIDESMTVRILLRDGEILLGR